MQEGVAGTLVSPNSHLYGRVQWAAGWQGGSPSARLGLETD